MKHLALALLCACLASPALAAKSAVIDGKRVVLGKRVRGVPLFDVTDLKFYDAVMPKNGERCTVVSGNLTSRLKNKHFVVTIDILLYQRLKRASGTPGGGPTGRLQAVLDRPEPNQPIRFAARCPHWKRLSSTGPTTLAYHVTVSFTRWRPSEPE